MNITQEKAKRRVLAELAQRVPHYAPEWRYNEDTPDVGATLAFLWADMLAGTVARYGLLQENCHRAMLDAIGASAKPALPSMGYLVFEPEEYPVIVPKGTGAACAEKSGAVLATDRELVVSSAEIAAVYYASPAKNAVCRYDGRSSLPLFRADTAQPHKYTFFHPFAFDVTKASSLKIEAELSGGGFIPGELFSFDDELPCRKVELVVGAKDTDWVLSAFRTVIEENGLPPDAVYAEDTQQLDKGFEPFGRRFIPQMCFYAACAAASKPGASVTLAFDLRFESEPLDGHTEPYQWEKPPKGMKYNPPKEYIIDVTGVVWEYFNGTGWAALCAGGAAVFADGRDGRHEISFTCPHDISPSVFGAHELPFIRARITEVGNFGRLHGCYRVPVVSNIKFGYKGSFAVTETEVASHFETRRAELTYPVQLVNTVPSPSAVYFAFEQAFERGSVLFDIALGGGVPVTWEYYANGQWLGLDVYDGTLNLSKTGIVSYQTPVPCEKTRLFGREAYWMRVCDTDGVYERDPSQAPVLRGIYENAVTATAVEAGEQGNLAENSFSVLVAPLAGVAKVYNPYPAFGGISAESERRITERVTAAFNHQNRAVSALDYEHLALEASPRVHRVRCYPNTNENGGFAYDCNCLAVLSVGGAHKDFEMLNTQVRKYITARMSIGAPRLCVVEPNFAAVSVRLQAAITEPEAALLVKQQISQMLASYFDPISGNNGKGWNIGELPALGDVSALLKELPEIRRVFKISVTYEFGGIPMDYARAVRVPFVVPSNGVHEIALTSRVRKR